MHVAIYPDSNTLSHKAAKYIVRLATEAIASHGHFTIALSGGSTPKALYTLLGNEPYPSQIDWALVEIFWSDERCVPPDSSDSNYQLAQEVLLSKVPIAANQIHRMPADKVDRDAASLDYTQEMQRVFGTDGYPVSTSCSSVWDQKVIPPRSSPTRHLFTSSNGWSCLSTYPSHHRPA